MQVPDPDQFRQVQEKMNSIKNVLLKRGNEFMKLKPVSDVEINILGQKGRFQTFSDNSCTITFSKITDEIKEFLNLK